MKHQKYEKQKEIEIQYNVLTRWCRSRLENRLHQRHLEDIVQHIAMEVIEHGDVEKLGLKGAWEWYFCNYCRENGINKNNRSKVAAKTLENSSFVGDDTWKIDRPVKTKEGYSFLELMDEFLSQLKLKKGTYIWVMKMQEKSYRHKELTKFNWLV